MIEFKVVKGSQGRGWVSEDGVWEVVMMGMGRYRLAHMVKGRTVLGVYKSLEEARSWAEQVAGLLSSQG